MKSYPLADDFVHPVLRVGMPRASRSDSWQRAAPSAEMWTMDHQRWSIVGEH